MHRNIVLVAIMGLGIGLFYGCDSGGSGSTTSQMRVLAKNVLFSSSIANAASKTEGVDETTQVLAENVVVDPSGNALSSDNLQSALDNELAIDLSTLLPGTTWTITNKTGDTTYSGTIGQVIFSDNGTFTLDSGRFAAAGIVAASEDSYCYTPPTAINYELLSSAIMYVSWTPTNETIQQDAVITIIAKSKDSLVLIGSGGCGSVGPQRISVLAKAQ